MQGINFIYYRKNISKKNGTAPVMLRFFVGNRKREINTKVYVEPAHWDDVKKCVKKNAPNASDLNLILHNEMRRIVDIFTRYRLQNKKITNEQLTKEIQKYTCEYELFQWLKDECLSRFHLGLINEDSRDHHLSVFAKLQRFNDKLMFDDINHTTLDAWRKFMRINLKNKINTIHAALKCLKTYMGIAFKKGLIENDVFRNYKLPTTEKHDIYLSLTDLKKLENYRANYHIKDDSHKASIDVFLFCCYTGLAIGELRALRTTDIVEMQKIKFLNVNQRVKNRPSRMIPLSNKALRLIDMKNANHLMYIPAAEVVNRTIKDYLILAGVTTSLAKKITLHKARHTFATIMISEINADIQTVSKLLGHKRVATTLETYSHLIPNKQVDYIKKFENL